MHVGARGRHLDLSHWTKLINSARLAGQQVPFDVVSGLSLQPPIYYFETGLLMSQVGLDFLILLPNIVGSGVTLCTSSAHIAVLNTNWVKHTHCHTFVIQG